MHFGYLHAFLTICAPNFSSILDLFDGIVRNDQGKAFYEYTPVWKMSVGDLNWTERTHLLLSVPRAMIHCNTDWYVSNIRVGCVLLHCRTDRHDRPFSYWSRTLNDSEMILATMLKECLAVVWGFFIKRPTSIEVSWPSGLIIGLLIAIKYIRCLLQSRLMLTATVVTWVRYYEPGRQRTLSSWCQLEIADQRHEQDKNIRKRPGNRHEPRKNSRSCITSRFSKKKNQQKSYCRRWKRRCVLFAGNFCNSWQRVEAETRQMRPAGVLHLAENRHWMSAHNSSCMKIKQLLSYVTTWGLAWRG